MGDHFRRMSVPQAQHHTLIPVQVQGSGIPNERRLLTAVEVQAAAQVCEDKKGENTRILALDPVDSGLADFFLVTSALNDRQAQTIADEIELRLKREFGVLPASVEGRRHGEWILLDYVDFVVHVFLAERRAYYDIERLRKSARLLTPAEFDQELKAALAAKTRAARGKTSSKAGLKPERVTESAVRRAGNSAQRGSDQKLKKTTTRTSTRTKSGVRKKATGNDSTSRRKS